MFCFILKQLNKIKSFPYYFLVVVPYAIGTGCEQALVLSLSKENKRQIVIFSYSCFKKLLNISKKFSSVIINLYTYNYMG